MLQHLYPLFNRGRIMKKEMLQAIRDQGFDFAQINYQDYADGIITGCKVTVTDEHIQVGPGMIKYGQILYLNPEIDTIAYGPTDQTVVLSYAFLEKEQDADFSQSKAQLVITNAQSEQVNQLELGRYKLKPGAKLRTDYVDYEDMSTEYDTLSILHSPFAAIEQSTLAPEITKRFAQEALPYLKENPWDIAFSLLILNSHQALSRGTIVQYLEKHGHILAKEAGNLELYNKLRLVLRHIKSGTPDANYIPQTGGRRQIMCD